MISGQQDYGSNKTRKIQTDFVEMWLENGIVNVVYLHGPELTVDVARDIVKQRLTIHQGEVFPVCTFVTPGIKFEKEVRDIFAKEDAIKFVSAGAIIINNQIQKLLGNVFLLINKPKIPARLFTDKESAVKWLEHYKYQN